MPRRPASQRAPSYRLQWCTTFRADPAREPRGTGGREHVTSPATTKRKQQPEPVVHHAGPGQSKAVEPKRLSLPEKAVIVEAVRRNEHLNAAELARDMGRNRFTVFDFIQRVRKAGGWYTEIVWRQCVHCEKPMAVPKAGSGRGGAKYHDRCKQAWRWRQDRAKRALVEVRLPGSETNPKA